MGEMRGSRVHSLLTTPNRELSQSLCLERESLRQSLLSGGGELIPRPRGNSVTFLPVVSHGTFSLRLDHLGN